jgi:hypothetical protein
MTDVSRLTVDVAVLHRNDELVRQQGRKDVDAALLVGFGPLQLKRTNGIAF